MPGRSQAASAGLAAILFYAFVPLPLQVAVAADLGLSDAEASRWIAVVWATGAIASIALSVAHRQPVAITWSGSPTRPSEPIGFTPTWLAP